MSKSFAVLLPLVALIAVMAVIQFGTDALVDQAASEPSSFPTMTPFVSPLCGKDNRNCSDEDFILDWQEPQPFKGLSLPNQPR
jgi:hypothetical protein